MVDQADLASERVDLINQVALDRKKEEAPKEVGICLNCGEEGIAGRWCNLECRDEWEEERKIERL